MKIGFDAKRAFHNQTGLGNYSRTLIHGLATYYPEHHYYLLNPKPSRIYHPKETNVTQVLPAGMVEKRLSSIWRSSWIKQDLKKLQLDLYHGLSNEIPVGMRSTGIPSVVTIHDLIFERFPKQFNRIDVGIYRKKYRYACNQAHRIIAISEQTKNDIVSFYGIDPSRIDVCYQSCDPVFGLQVSAEKKHLIREQYRLPDSFFLSVGSIIERKNLLNICKAMVHLKDEMHIPLVVIGRGGNYLRKVQSFIQQNGLAGRVIFLSGSEQKGRFALHDPATLAALYQMSRALVYPSFFEGFGIPVLEALWSRVPVITSRDSCLPEAGGPRSYYVDPANVVEIAKAMREVHQDEARRKEMIEAGWAHAQNFSLKACTDSLVQVYKKTLGHE